jgi:hypothetical protein
VENVWRKEKGYYLIGSPAEVIKWKLKGRDRGGICFILNSHIADNKAVSSTIHNLVAMRMNLHFTPKSSDYTPAPRWYQWRRVKSTLSWKRIIIGTLVLLGILVIMLLLVRAGIYLLV